ncbi:MAG TPA: polysaccharide biosynthesis tyrosine autokinase [Paludibacteraceae bacterium]|nr:polysaccharide biosynthesis tyrosine autokinase [Paludibacteraceae bacterium]
MNPDTGSINQNFTEEESSFDFQKWLHLFIKNWYLFLIFIPFFLIGGYLKNRSWMPLYQSVGTIIINENKYRSSSQGFMQGFGLEEAYQNVNNQVIILNSYDLIGKVVDSLPFMKVDYLTIGRFKTRNLYTTTPIIIEADYVAPEAYELLFKISLHPNGTFTISPHNNNSMPSSPINGHIGVPLQHNLFFMTVNSVSDNVKEFEMYFRFRTRETLIEDFKSRLSSRYVIEGSSILEISLISETPDRDVDFINKLSEIYLEENLKKKNDVASKTIQFINEQLSEVSKSLSVSEDEMTRFRRDNQIIDISSHGSELMSKANSLDEKKAELKLKETYLNYLTKYLTGNFEEGTVVAPSNLGLNEPLLMQLVQQINELYLQRSELTEKNLYYAKYTKAIENVKTSIFELIKNMRASLEIEKNEVNRLLADVNSQIAELPKKELEIIGIERNYKVNDNYYTFFLQKRAEAEIQKASNTPDNNILDQARTVSLINADVKSNTMFMFILLGILIPSLIIVLKEVLNNTIRSIKDIEKRSVFPVIGMIRHAKNDLPDLTLKNPKSSFTEMFRVIRTRVEFVVRRKTDIVMMVTSVDAGDGKTFFSTNMAGVYGMTGHKTLLIDMDIRKPAINRRFNVNHPKGVTNYLINECTLDEIINVVPEVNYDVIFAGTVPPNPAELIRSEKIIEMMGELRKRYDYIILDSSPIGLVTDSFSLASLADVNLLVVRNNKTHKDFFKNVVNQIVTDKLSNFYVVFTDVETDGNYYSYKYGYSSKYGYYTSKGQKNIDDYRKYYDDNNEI